MTPASASALARLMGDDLLGRLPARVRARILGQLQAVEYAAGTVIHTTSEPSQGLLFLDEGAVEWRTSAGLVQHQSGGRLGDESWNGSPYLSTAVAQTDIRGWWLPASVLSSLCKERPELRAQGAQALAMRMAGAIQEDAVDDGMESTSTVRAAHHPPTGSHHRGHEASTSEIAGWAMLVVAPGLVYWAGLEWWGLTVQGAIFSAILSGVVIMWTFELVDEFVPPVVAMVATAIAGLAPPSVTLGGFSSPGLMSLLGIFALGVVLVSSGLSYRVLLWLLTRLPNRPAFQHGSFLGLGFVLSMFLSSVSARVVLMRPMWRDSVDSLRLSPLGVGATSLYAAMAAGAALMAPMLATGKSSNMALVSMLPVQMQQEFVGLYWLVCAAAAAVLLALAHLMACRLFIGTPDAALPSREALNSQLVALGPLSPREWTAAGGLVFLILALASAQLHRIQPAWVSGALLVALLMIGALTRQDFSRRIEWPALFMLLGTASIMRVMDYLGVSQALAQGTADALGPIKPLLEDQPLLFVVTALVVTLTVRLALQVAAAMITCSLILMPLAGLAGVHPWVCIFLVGLFSEIVILRSQSMSLTIGRREGDFEFADEARYMRYFQAMSAARVVVAFASIPWWRSLGLA